MKCQNRVYISIGTNMGGRMNNIKKCLFLMERNDIRIIRCSNIYRTSPIGFLKQRDFYNAVLKIKTNLPPLKLLELFKDIEKRMGRVKNEKWGPRVIDIDILLYNDIIINNENLKIPHKEIENRYFVLKLLKEIDGDLRMPNSKKSIDELINKAKKEKGTFRKVKTKNNIRSQCGFTL